MSFLRQNLDVRMTSAGEGGWGGGESYGRHLDLKLTNVFFLGCYIIIIFQVTTRALEIKAFSSYRILIRVTVAIR